MFIGIDGTGPANDTRTFLQKWYQNEPPKYFSVNGRSNVSAKGPYMDRVTGHKYPNLPNQSFVWQIYNHTPEKNRAYYEGPTNLGLDVNTIANQAFQQILTFNKKGDSKILMAGWSRGAAICVRVAQMLRDDGNFGDVIDCIALFDAVDRSIQMNVDVIPNIVVKAYHAMRDPAVKSWTFDWNKPLEPDLFSFGNTCTKSERSGGLESKHFFATHAGIGGVPWTGDTPNIVNKSGKVVPTITKEQDILGANAVKNWMWQRIRQHGMI